MLFTEQNKFYGFLYSLKKNLFIFFCFLVSVVRADYTFTLSTTTNNWGGSGATVSASFSVVLTGQNTVVSITNSQQSFFSGSYYVKGGANFVNLGVPLILTAGQSAVFYECHNAAGDAVISGTNQLVSFNPLGAATRTVTALVVEPQQITADKLSGVVYKGSTVTGQASGKASDTSYTLRVTSSTGGGSINSATGVYVLSPSAVGALTFEISATASASAGASNVLSGSLDVKESNKFKYMIPFNNGKYPIKYELWQGDTKLGEYTVQPGEGGTIATLDLAANDAPVTVKSYVLGVTSDGVNTVTEGTSQKLSKVETFTPEATDAPTTQNITAPPVADPTASTPAAISERSGTVWSKPTTTATGTNQAAGEGDGLTNQVYREGVGKVVDKLEQIEIAKSKEKETAQKSASDSFLSAKDSGASASSQASGVVPALSGRSSYSSASGSPDLIVRLPQAFGGLSFDLNPFSNSRFAGVCAWFKSACLWLVVLQFAFFAWAEVKTSFALAIVAPQAKGNTIAAGTGGQATALLAAGGITVALLAFFLAVMALFTGDFSLSSIASHLGSDPLVGIGSGVLWMIEQLLPVSFIIGAYVFRLIFKVSCLKLVLGLAAVVRFVIP